MEVTRTGNGGSGCAMAVRSQDRAGPAALPGFAPDLTLLAAFPSPRRGKVKRANCGRANVSIGLSLRLRGEDTGRGTRNASGYFMRRRVASRGAEISGR